MSEFKTDGGGALASVLDGTIKIRNPKYECPKHGVTDAVLMIRIYEPMTDEEASNWQAPRTVRDQRDYCCHCYLEALDRLGVCVMQKLSD